jgi:hypothetical protein
MPISRTVPSRGGARKSPLRLATDAVPVVAAAAPARSGGVPPDGGSPETVEGTDIDPQWRKASYSGGANGSCVEVGNCDGVMVRDTTDRDGGTLAFSAAAWQTFTGGLK